MNATGTWADSAECSGYDPAIWFPPEIKQRAGQPVPGVPPRAAAICARCPVRRDCLEYALRNRVLGIWGGTTTHDRDRLRNAAGIRPTPVVVSQAL